MKVINIKDNKGWVGHQDYLPIHRGTPYGNVFDMKDYRRDRDLVIELFTERLLYNLTTSTGAVKNLLHLFATDPEHLGCFCAPKPCHGDVYVRLYELWRKKGGDFQAMLDAYKIETGYVHYPLLDGIYHINTYSKSRTELGRLLSNFANTPFEHPEYGFFESMEGFWYWCATGKKHEVLKTVYGYEAKKFGMEYEPIHNDAFEYDIYQGMVAKLVQTPRLHEQLSKNHLPLAHYYTYGEPDVAVVREASELFLKLMNRAVASVFPVYTTIIAGSRNFSDKAHFDLEMSKVPWRIGKVIEGGAKGTDLLGRIYAQHNHLPWETVEAEWEKSDGGIDKSAGMRRNARMGEMAEAGVVMILNDSKGSTHMAKWLRDHDKHTHVVHIDSIDSSGVILIQERKINLDDCYHQRTHRAHGSLLLR